MGFNPVTGQPYEDPTAPQSLSVYSPTAPDVVSDFSMEPVNAPTSAQMEPGAAQAKYLELRAKGATPEQAASAVASQPAQPAPVAPAGPPAPSPLPDVSKGPAEPPVQVYDPKEQSYRLASPEEAKAMELAGTSQQMPGGAGAVGGGVGGGPAGLPKRIAATDPLHYGQTPTEVEWHKKVYEHQLAQAGFAVDEATNQATLAAQQSAIYADAAQKYSAMLDEQRQRDAERQAWVQTAIDKHEQIANGLAQQEIDPDHFFTSKGTAGAIMAGLGMAFSGIGDAILMAAGNPSGGQFMARAMSLVDRDIAVQKANFQLKRDAFGAQMGVFAERVRAFGDERVAEASARASIFDWLSMETRAYQAKAFEGTTRTAVGQIAEALSFQAEQYKNGIAIASEHAYDDAAAKAIAQYWAQVAAYNERIRKAQEEQNKFIQGVLGDVIKKDGMPSGAVTLGVYPKGHPLAGQYGWIMDGKDGGSPYMQPLGGFNTGESPGATAAGGQIVLPHGIKPGSKQAAEYVSKQEAKMAGINWGGQRYTVFAHSEQQAGKLTAAMMESQNYAQSIKQMMDILDDKRLNPYEKYKLYTQAFHAAGGAYKQIYNLGAYDLGVQQLVEGSLPDYSTAMIAGGTAKKMLQQQLVSAHKIAKSALTTYADPSTFNALPDVAPEAMGAYSSLGAVKVDDQPKEGSLLGKAAMTSPLMALGGPAAGLVANYYNWTGGK